MRNLPYFRWYPADAETDEFYSSLTDQELGFYHRCLNRSWINNGLPPDMDDLARLMRVSRKYLDKVWAKIGARFVSNECARPRLINPRQEDEREYAVKKGDKASTAAAHGQSDGSGFIYLISRPSDGATKIGSAVSVPRRLAQLKYKFQEALVLVGEYQVDNMSEVEVALHAKFQHRRVGGEWFKLSTEEQGDIAITLGGDSQGDTWGDSADHPKRQARPRADSDSISGSTAGVLKVFRKPEIPGSPVSQRFDEFMAVYPVKVDIGIARGVWETLVSPTEENAVFACLARYMESDRARESPKNPSNWLHDCARDGWKSEWPPARASPVKDKSFFASVSRVMSDRVKSGEEPLP